MEKVNESLFSIHGKMDSQIFGSFRPSELGQKLLNRIKSDCPCGCGNSEKICLDYGNCVEARFFLSYICGAEGVLRIWDDGIYVEWDLDVELV